MRSLVITAVLALAGSARAETPVPELVVSLPVPSLTLTGAAVQGEKYFGREYSLAASLGVRSAASGDYDSLTVGAGVEGRWYWWKKRPGRGPFLAVRLDVGHVSVEDTHDGRALGGMWELAESALVGWRWILWKKLEISPSVGLGRVQSLPGGTLAAEGRGVLTVGLTLGWIVR